jgi:hypothetical protein
MGEFAVRRFCLYAFFLADAKEQLFLPFCQ